MLPEMIESITFGAEVESLPHRKNLSVFLAFAAIPPCSGVFCFNKFRLPFFGISFSGVRNGVHGSEYGAVHHYVRWQKYLLQNFVISNINLNFDFNNNYLKLNNAK